jgi:hypothetical protein
MKQELYHPGDRVKIYFPGGVVKGEVIGVQNVSVEDAAGTYFCTTRAYLVICDRHIDEDRSYIVTAPFLARDRSRG